MAFEGSKKDLREDKILAKKHKMSFDEWEKSPMDRKHDAQRSMMGLKKGGPAKAGNMPMNPMAMGRQDVPSMQENPRYNARALRPGGMAKGGRACAKASGGVVRGTGIATKGKGKGRIC